MPTDHTPDSTTMGLESTEQWERWCGSTTQPEVRIKRGAKVTVQQGVKWITYPDEINGDKVIVEMPLDAPTKSCHEGRHDDCPHRLGAPQEGGVTLRMGLTGGTWRCGCTCHRDAHRVGRLF